MKFGGVTAERRLMRGAGSGVRFVAQRQNSSGSDLSKGWDRDFRVGLISRLREKYPTDVLARQDQITAVAGNLRLDDVLRSNTRCMCSNDSDVV